MGTEQPVTLQNEHMHTHVPEAAFSLQEIEPEIQKIKVINANKWTKHRGWRLQYTSNKSKSRNYRVYVLQRANFAGCVLFLL